MCSPTRDHKYNTFLLIFVLFAVVVACENNASRKAQAPTARPAISTIQNKEQLNQIIATSGNRLLVFEFYADWCAPCRELTPILEEIAKENSGVLDLYKIDTDKNSDLARDFRVTGIPHVLFFKNQESVMSLSGLYPKQMYLKVISRFTQVVADKKSGRQGGT